MKIQQKIRVWSIAAAACATAFAAAPRPAKDYGKSPLTFEANVGQTDGRVKYLSRGAGYTMFLTSGNEAVVSLSRTASSGKREATAVRMTLPGSKTAESIQALEPQSTVSNYLYGSDPKRWMTGVKHYGRVSYSGVYPGVDLVYYGNQRQLEYDFVVAPGADPKAIRLKFDADKVSTENGDLLLHTRYGALRQLKPVVYQEIGGERRYVAANYVIRNKEARFAIGEYDRSKKLVIDPILVYSTFLGGSATEKGLAIAVDAAQAAYVVGSTESLNFPLLGAIAGQTGFKGGTTDAYLVRYGPAGAVTSSTYIGGSGADEATGVAVDSEGNVIVGGNTDSTDFPLRLPLQGQVGGKTDAFLLKVTASNELVFSTYIGGFEIDNLNGLAVDSGNNIIAGGLTYSTNFWASGGFQSAFHGVNGSTEGWVFKTNPAGVRLWSSYLGGFGNDAVNGLALDTQGNVYLTGFTTSIDFLTTPGAFQPNLRQVNIPDAFVTKIDANGSPTWSTYLGGTAYDEGIDIAVNAAGNAFVTGNTDSSNFPVLNTLQGPPGNRDTFVTKLSVDGKSLAFSTYLAGSGTDTASDIALDPAGDVYVIGSTNSLNFPLASPMQASLSGGSDLYVTKINSAGTARVWSTYLGGLSDDAAGGIAIDSQANLYLTGNTISPNFPQVGASVQAYGGSYDAFVSKIAGCDIGLSPGSANFGVNAASGSFQVLSTNCPWTATVSDSSWITITSPASGTTTSNITYTLTANTGVGRSGFISVSGVQFAITQAGLSTAAPTVVSLTPSSGGGASQIFTARYATANPGGATIDRAYLLINTSITGAGGCLVEFSPPTSTYRLIADDGTTWSAPAVAGTSVTLSNSQCSLNVASSSGGTFVGTGVLDTIVNFALTFTPSFSGAKNTYLLGTSEIGRSHQRLGPGWYVDCQWHWRWWRRRGSRGFAVPHDRGRLQRNV